MYTIEYDENIRKPEINESAYTNNGEMFIGAFGKRYNYQKDMDERCFNIKSLTIDLEDISQIIKDHNTGHLLGLYAMVNNKITDKSINAITILNNSLVGKLIIYSIITCKWMVNSDEKPKNEDILETLKEIKRLTNLYEKTTDEFRKKHLKDEIELLKYYRDTIATEDVKKQKINAKILKV